MNYFCSYSRRATRIDLFDRRILLRVPVLCLRVTFPSIIPVIGHVAYFSCPTDSTAFPYIAHRSRIRGISRCVHLQMSILLSLCRNWKIHCRFFFVDWCVLSPWTSETRAPPIGVSLFYLDLSRKTCVTRKRSAFNVQERITGTRVRCFLIRGFRMKYLVDAIGQWRDRSLQRAFNPGTSMGLKSIWNLGRIRLSGIDFSGFSVANNVYVAGFRPASRIRSFHPPPRDKR